MQGFNDKDINSTAYIRDQNLRALRNKTLSLQNPADTKSISKRNRAKLMSTLLGFGDWLDYGA